MKGFISIWVFLSFYALYRCSILHVNNYTTNTVTCEVSSQCTLRGAISIANQNDEIIIHDGTYLNLGEFGIDKNLSFSGTNRNDVFFIGYTSFSISTDSRKVEFSNFTIERSNDTFIRNSASTIIHLKQINVFESEKEFLDSISSRSIIIDDVNVQGGVSPIFQIFSPLEEIIFTKIAIHDCTGNLPSVYINNAVSIELKDCHFENNSVPVNQTNPGGGCFSINGYSGEVQITGSTFIENSGGGNGGGLWVKTGPSLLIQDCWFERNSVSRDDIDPGEYSMGGAGYFNSIDEIVMERCSFSENVAYAAGAAIYVYAGLSLTMTNCVSFRNLVTSQYLGASIYLVSTDDVFVNNCSFSNNTAYLYPALNCQSCDNLYVENSLIFNNTGTSTYGALSGFYIAEEFIVKNCTFSFNRCPGGGSGLHMHGCASGSNFEIIDSLFHEHEGDSSVYAWVMDSLKIINSTFTENYDYFALRTSTIFNVEVIGSHFIGNENGGGYHITTKQHLNYTNCVFVDNRVEYEGAGVKVSTSETSSFSNCSFQGNDASNSYGGGIFIMYTSFIHVDRCKFENNDALYGGGVWFQHVLLAEITDSIFRNNSAVNAGGGLGFYGSSDVKLIDNFFIFNEALGYCGGGVYANNDFYDINMRVEVFSSSRLPNGDNNIFSYEKSELIQGKVEGVSVFYHNRAKYGGGFAFRNAHEVNVTSIGVFDNEALSRGGGGFAMNNALGYWSCSTTYENCTSDVSISHVNFNGNKVVDSIEGYSGGGGMYIQSITRSLVEDCVFEENYSLTEFGALDFQTGYNHTVRRSRFSRNSAFYHAAVSSFWFIGQTIIEDCLFEENVAQISSALHLLGNENSVLSAAFVRNNRFFRNSGSTALFIWKIFYDLEIIGNVIEGTSAEFNEYRSNVGGAMDLYGIFTNSTRIYHNILRENKAVSGGGIFFSASSTFVDVWNTTFDSNTAIEYGGALDLLRTYERDYEVHFKDCIFMNNTSEERDGGAVFSRSPIEIKFSNCQILGNTAHSGSGGGIWIEYGDYATIEDCVIDSNTAFFAGGIGIEKSDFSTSISNVSFISNRAGLKFVKNTGVWKQVDSSSSMEGLGGGLYLNTQDDGKESIIYSCGTLEDSEDILIKAGEHNNLTTDDIYETCTTPVSVTVSDCSFVGNSGVRGGGLLNRRNSLLIQDSIFENNEVTESGGGISLDSSVLIIHKDFGERVLDMGVKIHRNSFSENICDSAASGCSLFLTGYVEVNDSTFIRDSGPRGVSIMSNNGDDLEIKNCLFKNSVATEDSSSTSFSVHLVSSTSKIKSCSFIDIEGGCLIVEGGSVEIEESIFSSCSSGGGVRLSNLQKGSSSMKDVTISNCTTKYKGNGGGLFMEDFQDDFTMERVDVSNCDAVDGCGGGMYLRSMGENYISFNGTSIINCSADFGGAIAFGNNVDEEKIIVSGVNIISGCVGLVGGGSVMDMSGIIDISLLGFNFENCGEKDYISCFSSKPRDILGKSILFYGFDENIEFDKTNSSINSTEIVSSRRSSSSSLGLTTVGIFPGKPFELVLNIVDDYGQIVKQYPDFSCSISIRKSNGEVTDEVKLKGSYFEVGFQGADIQTDETKLEENLFFSGFQVQKRMDLLLESDEQEDEEEEEGKYYEILISSEMINNELVIPVMIDPCPYMFYFEEQLSSGYVECTECPKGYYSLELGSFECIECPDHVKCSDSEVISDQGYWVRLDYENGVVEVSECDNGNCLGGNSIVGTTNECDENFNSSHPICATCKEGFSEYNSACIECRGVNVFMLLIYIISMIIITISIHYNSQNIKSGIEKIFSFFGQTSQQLMVGVKVSISMGPLLGLLFNMRIPSFGGTGSFLSCPFERSGHQKVMFEMLQPLMFAGVIILLMIFVILVKSCCFFGTCCCFCGKLKKKKKKNKKEEGKGEREGEEEEEEEGKGVINEKEKQKEEDMEEKQEYGDTDTESETESSSTTSGDENYSVIDYTGKNKDEESVVITTETLVKDLEEGGEEEQEEGDFKTDSESDDYKSSNSNEDETEKSDLEDHEEDEENKNTAERIFKYYLLTKLEYLWHQLLCCPCICGGKMISNLYSTFFNISSYCLTVVQFQLIYYQVFLDNSMSYFSCVRFGGKYYLRKSTDVLCYEGELYWSWFWLFLIILIFCIVFPFLLFTFLVCCYYRLDKKSFRKFFGTLYGNYRKKYYARVWMEPLSMLRRLVIVTLVTQNEVLGRDLSKVLIAIVLIISLVVQVLVKPFKNKIENIMESISFFSLLVIHITVSSMDESQYGFRILIWFFFMPTFVVLFYYNLREIWIVRTFENCLKCIICCRMCCLIVKIVNMERKTRSKVSPDDSIDDRDEEDLSNIDKNNVDTQ